MVSIWRILPENNLESKQRAMKCDKSYLDFTQSKNNVKY